MSAKECTQCGGHIKPINWWNIPDRGIWKKFRVYYCDDCGTTLMPEPGIPLTDDEIPFQIKTRS